VSGDLDLLVVGRIDPGGVKLRVGQFTPSRGLRAEAGACRPYRRRYGPALGGGNGWLAMILGIAFTIVVGCGLMGLMLAGGKE